MRGKIFCVSSPSLADTQCGAIRCIVNVLRRDSPSAEEMPKTNFLKDLNPLSRNLVVLNGSFSKWVNRYDRKEYKKLLYSNQLHSLFQALFSGFPRDDVQYDYWLMLSTKKSLQFPIDKILFDLTVSKYSSRQALWRP